MALIDGTRDMAAVRARAERAMLAPIGMMSPLWFVFGAAASAGAAWWWMTRWAKPVNVEAAMDLPAAVAKAEATPEVITPAEVATPVEVVTPIAVVAAAEAVDSVEASDGPEYDVAEPDDLTQIAGVGPKVARALNDYGVTTFAQLAAWTADELAAFDAALGLKGNTIRRGIVDQARRLAGA